jgi:GR25 family glycosyltransferase involved in LPS biosynthesis
MNLPIYVINMEAANKRWELVQNAGDQAGLDLIRVDAFDGKSLPYDEWVDINRDEFALNTAREILPGEYGCYRSHISTLEMFIDSGSEHGVILEDDILPDDELLGRIEAMISEVNGFDLVKLVNHRSSGFISLLKTSKGDEIGRTLFGPQGSAAAYLLTREGAIKLVNSLRTMKLPWDVALERYWEIGANVLTVRANVLEFSEERPNSNITTPGQGYRKKLSFGHYIRRGARVIPDFFHRFYHALKGSGLGIGQSRQHPVDTQPASAGVIFAIIAFLVMASVFWLESDAYRYACLALVVPSLYFYTKHAFWRYDRPRIGVVGILCISWALYVLVRYLYGLIFFPGQGTGSAEGIYLFPLLYATLGYSFWRFCRKPFPIVVSFLIFSILAMLVSTDYSSIVAGIRATTFAHNNTIHAANASGFILIFATGEGLITSIENMISSSNIPLSSLVRLQMWLDVMTIWSKSPILGIGVSWTDLWEQRLHSSHLPLNILHNSFLEVGIRYGIVGLVFFGGLFVWSTKQVLLASKYHIIAPAAAICYISMLVFFLLSGLTNSNIRLALGESFMLLAVGFGFYCFYCLQELRVEKIKF